MLESMLNNENDTLTFYEARGSAASGRTPHVVQIFTWVDLHSKAKSNTYTRQHYDAHNDTTAQASRTHRVGALLLSHPGLGSTLVGPSRTPTVQPCSSRREGRGWLDVRVTLGSTTRSKTQHGGGAEECTTATALPLSTSPQHKG